MLDDVTGIVVVHNTKDLMEIAINSIRKYHAYLRLIIVNNCTPGHECDKFIREYPYWGCQYIHPAGNIGHGKGMSMALSICKTKQALIFDSDIEVTDHYSISNMQNILTDSEYGIGEICYADENGHNAKDGKGIRYLHPYYMLINVSQYRNFSPYIHHGAPCIKAMKDLRDQNKSDMLIEFPVKDYVKHEWKGTRKLNPPEFLVNWEKV